MAHSEHRFPAPSSKRKDVVNRCLEFACTVDRTLNLVTNLFVVVVWLVLPLFG